MNMVERDSETIHVDAPGNLIFNDVERLFKATLAGCGVVCVAEDQAATHPRAGNLRQILADFTPSLPSNYLYRAGRRHVPAPPCALSRTFASDYPPPH
jgi:DNA-binding transcriptional LysR family regulator